MDRPSYLATYIVAPLRSRASLHLEILALRHGLAVAAEAVGVGPQARASRRTALGLPIAAWSGSQHPHLREARPRSSSAASDSRWTRFGGGRRPTTRIATEDPRLIRRMRRPMPSSSSPHLQSDFEAGHRWRQVHGRGAGRPRRPAWPTWRAFPGQPHPGADSTGLLRGWTSSLPHAVHLDPLAHDQRRVVHFDITGGSRLGAVEQLGRSSERPWETAPRFLPPRSMGLQRMISTSSWSPWTVEEVIQGVAARSSWQSPYVERMIGKDPSRMPRPRHGAQRAAPVEDASTITSSIITAELPPVLEDGLP